MKLTKFGILVNKTTSLFTSIRDSKISRGCAKILEIPEGTGGGVNFGGRFWKIQRGGGGRSYGKSLPWWGGMDIFWNHTMNIFKFWIHLKNQPPDSIAKLCLNISHKMAKENKSGLINKINLLCTPRNINKQSVDLKTLLLSYPKLKIICQNI